MADTPIYLGYPNGRSYPDMPRWIGEVVQLIETDADWNDWRVSEMEYNMSCALQINDVASLIKSDIGPCILIAPVQHTVFIELRQRLYGRSVVLTGDVTDPTDILQLMHQAREQHSIGEPMLPRKLVIALLLIAKLERHQMWRGSNKGYMWTDNLTKGRGLDEEFADQLPAVINDFGLRQLLIKKTSNRRGKYALNPERRVEIYDALRDGAFEDELQERLMRDPRVESARKLDPIFDADFEVNRRD